MINSNIANNGKRRKGSHPLIEQYDDEFYLESEDEEINLKRIKKAEPKVPYKPEGQKNS